MTHVCHAEQCMKEVPPRLFMCSRHWFMLPKELRDAVWATYSRGQEVRKDPSREYLNVTQRCINFVAVKEGLRHVG